MSSIFYALVVTTDRARANQLAALIDPDTGGARTFDYAVPCYAPGTTFQASADIIPHITPSAPPVAWAVGIPLTQRGHDLCAEFLSDGPYPLLNGIGLTDERIADEKLYTGGTVGERATLEGTLPQFIAANGYVIP